MMTTFRSGKTTEREILSNMLEQAATHTGREDVVLLDKEYKWGFADPLKCAFYYEIFEELASLLANPQNRLEKIIREKYNYDYSRSSKEIAQRFVDFILINFNLSHIDELIKLKIERENLFMSSIR